MTDKAKKIEEHSMATLGKMELLFKEKEYAALALYSVQWKRIINWLKIAYKCAPNEDKELYDNLIKSWDTFDKKVNNRFRRIKNGGAF